MLWYIFIHIILKYVLLHGFKHKYFIYVEVEVSIDSVLNTDIDTFINISYIVTIIEIWVLVDCITIEISCLNHSFNINV